MVSFFFSVLCKDKCVSVLTLVVWVLSLSKTSELGSFRNYLGSGLLKASSGSVYRVNMCVAENVNYFTFLFIDW